MARDHWPFGYSMWLAGAGIQGGRAIGATDEFGFRAVEDRVHVNDLHATILKLLGLDHEKLTWLFQGRKDASHRRRRPQQYCGSAAWYQDCGEPRRTREATLFRAYYAGWMTCDQ